MPQLTHRILIVDDEPALRRALRTALFASGFTVDEASNGEQAIDQFSRSPADLVLLDINMPGIGGVETCRRLRNLGAEAGIVMITVRDSEDDQVRALEAGADDYVIKPYRFRELLARVKAVLRRIKPHARSTVRRMGDLELDLENRGLKKAGADVHLSPTEFDLMAFFFEHRGAPLTHAKLLRSIWGPEYGGELEYLRSYVRMLRKKIEDDPARPVYLVTEPWVGYRFGTTPERDE
ncbi:MAG TPA: response regulator transcription factor [Bryobacteraceae bacterium]|nr:response regulator transcription factor [Bryobacteraceae bacterium]